MNPHQLEALRERMLAEREDLLGRGPEALAPNRTDASSGHDDDTQSLNEMHQAIASARNRQRAARLAGIATALSRITADPEEYGVCEQCDGDIPVRRLELMPWATVCVPCQESLDAGPPGLLKRATRKKLTDHV